MLRGIPSSFFFFRIVIAGWKYELESWVRPRSQEEQPHPHPLHLQAPGIHWVPGVVIWKQTKQRITSWKAGALSANSLRRRQSLVCVGTLRQKTEPRGSLPVGAGEAEMLLCFTLVAFLLCFMVVFGAQSEPQGRRNDSLTLDHWTTPLGREHPQHGASPAWSIPQHAGASACLSRVPVELFSLSRCSCEGYLCLEPVGVVSCLINLPL